MRRTAEEFVTNDHKSALAEHLRDARPSLICRVEPQADHSFELAPFVVEVDNADVEIIDEGYDPYHSPLGCPVYWRIVKRPDGHFYYSTFQVPRHYILKVWGVSGLPYCDPVTGMAVARIETRLPNETVKGSHKGASQ
jgi:hypothetical protein